MLNDNLTYKTFNQDNTNKTQTNNNKIVKNLLTNEYIDKYTYYKLICHNGTISKCYFLPKVHKPEIPLRPIVSFINSPINLSKFIAQILNPLKHNSPYFLKNSFEFVKKIKQIQLPDNDHRFVSLDVKNLFTSIPLDLVIEGIEDRWEEIKHSTKLDLPTVQEIVTFCYNSSTFKFNSKMYQQINGLPMGSPISAILAEIVMYKLEREILSQPGLHPLIYVRYVDDIFCCLPEHEIDNLLHLFNSYHPNIQFTIEIELNNSLNFLDVTAIRVNRSVITNWYIKPIASGRCLNYKCHTPISYKRSVITSLVDRVVLLSDIQFHNKNISTIITLLKNNCYPHRFITQIINNRINTLNNRNNTNITHNAFKYISLPYIPQITHNINKIITEHNLKIATTNKHSIKNTIFTQIKDTDNKELRSNLVYEISCDTCNIKYIGETKQYLKKRIQQHLNHCSNGNREHSGLCCHIIDTGHSFNFDNSRIITFETNINKRKFIENCCINTNLPNLNNQTNYHETTRPYLELLTNLYKRSKF